MSHTASASPHSVRIISVRVGRLTIKKNGPGKSRPRPIS
jgi:hypothetical protein